MKPIPSIIEEDIAPVLGIERMTEEERAETLLSIHKIIFERLMLDVVRAIPEDKGAALDALLATDPSPEELTAFLSANVPDFESIVLEAIAQFKQDAKEVMSPFSSEK